VLDRHMLVVRRPLPGLTVARFAGERPLMRGIYDHFGTAMHLAGRSRWTIGGEPWSSGPGTISIKVPGTVAIERAREGALEFQVVLFESAWVDEARTLLGRHSGEPRTDAFDPQDPRAQPIASLHRILLTEAPLESLEESACNALHALIDAAFTAHGAESPARLSAAVARARTLLDARFTESIELEALAAHARLDKFRLCRAFREEVGLPPHAYVTHRRVALAQRLLSRGIPQAEVAARVGFYDQSLLHRHFKRILRLTPGAFARATAPRVHVPKGATR